MSVFGYENNKKFPYYISKKSGKTTMLIYCMLIYLLSHVLIKDFNTFMYVHKLHPGRKRFCHYCLQAFSTEDVKDIIYIKNSFEINDKTKDYVKFNNFERKMKYFLSLMEILKQFKCLKRMESKIQKSLILINIKSDYKIVCVYDMSSKAFKSYLGKDALYNFIDSMIEDIAVM